MERWEKPFLCLAILNHYLSVSNYFSTPSTLQNDRFSKNSLNSSTYACSGHAWGVKCLLLDSTQHAAMDDDPYPVHEYLQNPMKKEHCILGKCKSWTVDSGLVDCELDYGLKFGLGFGLKRRSDNHFQVQLFD